MMGQVLRVVGIALGLLVIGVCGALAALGITLWTEPGYRGDSGAMKVALVGCLVVALGAAWLVVVLIRRLRARP
jgi:hypothetical protein